MSRYTGNHWYEEFAGELLDSVCNDEPLFRCSATFADGLCGIGWSIEFLKIQGFIDEDTDNILDEIDRQVMERDVSRVDDYSLETGLSGIAAYVHSRLYSERSSATFQPFDQRYLEDLDIACQKANIPWRSKECEVLAVWNKIMQVFSLSKEMEWQRGLVMLNEIR